MKTKIIYISGGENLDMSVIKTAFDEVRQTLELGDDVLLFGVPLEDKVSSESFISEQINSAETIQENEKIEEIANESQTLSQEPIEANSESTPEVEHVIPILSVLSGGKSESVKEPVQTASVSDLSDALSEDLPIAEQKAPQTIEEIFENLTPLPEEKIIETSRLTISEISCDENITDDATLTMLATEFVETQNVQPESENERSSRIKKLKNILPFKKAKKEESSVLNDLFGWAGIAANEDDAGPSGFFASR